MAALAATGLPLAETKMLAVQSHNPYHTKGMSKRLSVSLPERTPAALAPVWVARAVSMLGGLLAVIGTWLLAQTLFPRAPSLAVATAAVVGFNPQFLFAAANMTNDAWSAALNVFALWVAARIVLTPGGDRRWFWVGVCAGLATLTKYSGFLLALPLLVLMVYHLYKTGWRAGASAVGYAALGALLTAGWYYARNLWLWGEVVPLTQMAQALPTLLRPHPFTLPQTLTYVPWLITSYWGVFVSLIAPSTYLGATRMFMAIGGIGLLIWPWRARALRYANDRLTLTMALFWFAAFALSVLNWTRTVDFGEQGRLLLAAAPALALLLTFGWQAWFPVRWHRRLHYAIAIFMVGLAFSQIGTLYTGYRLPATLVPPPQPQRPIGAQFTPGMQLLGIDLPSGAALQPGQPLPITFYFSTAQAIDGFYTLFIHLADEQNRLLFQFDGVPAQGRHPTRQWLPGAVFADTHMLTVDEPVAAGLATLSVGFYKVDDPAQRQTVINSQGDVLGDRLVLAAVRIHSGEQMTVPLSKPPVARWTGGIELAAVEVIRNAATLPLAVQITWQATGVVHTDYTIFVQLLGKDGAVLAQVDQQPQAGRWPTSTWQPGDVIEDVYTFDPPIDPSDVEWDKLIVGFYDQTGQRLRLQGDDPVQLTDFYLLLQNEAAR